jgi:hypothetical protein
MSSASGFAFLPVGSASHIDANALYRAYTWQLWCLGIAGFLVTLVQYLLAVPSDLRHLPRVSPYATIWSFARRVVFFNGEMWKRHSASVKAAFDREIPVHHFVALTDELFQRIDDGGVFRYSELVQVCPSI